MIKYSPPPSTRLFVAISEIATNKRVEGGGEYFIISRSFGMNIGATIGFALFISQAISGSPRAVAC